MSDTLQIKPIDDCQFDLVSLGEVMLRLDPGEGRIRTTRQFKAWEGGGEYNVARGLKRCFRLRTALVSAFADNEIGRLLEDMILQGGVDMSFVQWKPYDGIGREVRNGMNFTERGFGIRGAVGCSDRGHTAASRMRPGDVDWDDLFGRRGVRWFHTGGIFAALSETTPDVVIEAVQCARKHGTIVSYDLNYRPSLWKAVGGKEFFDADSTSQDCAALNVRCSVNRCVGIKKAQQVNREIAKSVDVMIGNEEDFTACLGLEVEGVDENVGNIQIDNFKRMIETAVAEYPNFLATGTTLREVHTATVNDWSAIVWHEGKCYESLAFPKLEILDRVGGGDSFASGLIYGFLATGDPQQAVNYGAAHGALAMTTPGDTTMATLEEVEKIMQGSGARVIR